MLLLVTEMYGTLGHGQVCFSYELINSFVNVSRRILL